MKILIDFTDCPNGYQNTKEKQKVHQDDRVL